MEVNVSVRGLVEFVLRSGDIDRRKAAAAADNAMQEGSRIHRMIQRRMGADYHAEVGLKHIYPTEDYDIVIEGRADGIIIQPIDTETHLSEHLQTATKKTEVHALPQEVDEPAGDAVFVLPQEVDEPAGDAVHALPQEVSEPVGDAVHALPQEIDEPAGQAAFDAAGSVGVKVTIDEIKGTYKELIKLKGPVPEHLAQAKCYAYFYAHQQKLSSIGVRMTYCHIETEQLRYFYYDYTFKELEEWFRGVMEEYKKWTDYSFAWEKERQISIKSVEFPYAYRKGQKELVTHVYNTIYHGRKLFIEAPTGVGKTLSTVFPAVKAMGEGYTSKIFYLTAKTITRTVAEEAFSRLRENGLMFKTVVITARDKICFLEEATCNPVDCPYARGHYDRINDAIYDLLTHEVSFGRELIEAYALKHQVCPFEMCLDMSLFSDGVICDYNYVFDPHVYLRRFFQAGVRNDYIFLVDEAHNLIDRGREMYSASLCKEDFLILKKIVKDIQPKIATQLEKCNKELLKFKRECESYVLLDSIEEFIRALTRLAAVMEDYLEDHLEGIGHQEILEFYFEISHFLGIYELLDEHYVVYAQMQTDGSFVLKLFCVDPSGNLKEKMDCGRSTILFSATLLPIQYYKKLLGAAPEDYEVYAESVFEPEKKGIFIARDVTSKYTRRSDTEYYNMAAYISKICGERSGNYMVFFPSHAFLKKVYEIFSLYFYEEDRMECLLQTDHMNEQERENFLDRFRSSDGAANRSVTQTDAAWEDEKTLIGFCVLGGIFSEGIDLKNDSLIGAIIVGTGLPQVCNEREILKKYFDEQGENGFSYAYQYPAMNKVEQAAGRVIRTSEDIGVIALLDDRFLQRSYQRLFPREWSHFEDVTLETIAKRVEKFWNDWL